MRHEIKQFLETTKDESIIRFILGNLDRSQIEAIFELLTQCNAESEDFWQQSYYKMYQ